MKNKLLALMLSGAMVFGLAACGGQNASDNGGASTDSGNTQTEEPAAEEEATGNYTPQWDTYDTLIKDIKTTTDFAARVDKMHQAEDMLMDTWAVIPIYYYNDIYMQKSNVDGIFSTVYGMKYFMYATKK